MHRCPSPGCGALVDDSLLACRRHWRKIPQPLRTRLWAAWDDGNGRGSEEHAEAVEACVAYLERTAA